MKKKLRIRLVFLYIGSFIVSIAPLLVILIINWGKYTETPGDTVKLCIGGVILLFFVFLKVIGKLHIPRRIILFAVVFLLSYLLAKVMSDMLILSGMALAGEALDLICFQGFIRKTQENLLIEKTADATTKKVEEVVKKYMGSGRV